MKKLFLFVCLICLSFQGVAQDDLLNELQQTAEPQPKQIEMAAFKGLQICNMQSTKLAAKGEWYFVVSHRFGNLKEGTNNFFGLDNAYTKIGGLYGVTNWLTLSASRHTYNKLYELSSKIKLANQEVDGFPVTIVAYHSMEINSELKKEDFPTIQFKDRLAFTSQLLVSKKINERISVELNGIYVHKNLYEPQEEQKDEILVATGGRCKLSKRLSMNIEYAARTNPVKYSPYDNPLALGLDIETGGHVFQMLFASSQPMNDVGYYTNGTGSWTNNTKGLYFGFNMYRVF
jgi:hypothetical protein